MEEMQIEGVSLMSGNARDKLHATFIKRHKVSPYLFVNTHGHMVPQTDISLFIQLTRRTVYFRLQMYFKETNISNS